MNNDKNIMTVSEFAEVFGISPTSAYKLVHSKDFPAFRVTSNSIRILHNEAIKWMINNQPM